MLLRGINENVASIKLGVFYVAVDEVSRRKEGPFLTHLAVYLHSLTIKDLPGSFYFSIIAILRRVHQGLHGSIIIIMTFLSVWCTCLTRIPPRPWPRNMIGVCWSCSCQLWRRLRKLKHDSQPLAGQCWSGSTGHPPLQRHAPNQSWKCRLGHIRNNRALKPCCWRKALSQTSPSPFDGSRHEEIEHRPAAFTKSRPWTAIILGKVSRYYWELWLLWESEQTRSS